MQPKIITLATKFSKKLPVLYELMLLLRRFEEKTGQLGMQKFVASAIYISGEAVAAGCMTATNLMINLLLLTVVMLGNC